MKERESKRLRRRGKNKKSTAKEKWKTKYMKRKIKRGTCKQD